jgi:hypothetical protein
MKFHESILPLLFPAILLAGAASAGWETTRAATASPKQAPSQPAPPTSDPALSSPPIAGTQSSSDASVPVDEIIRKFAEHESEFKVERGNYTYTQEVLVEDVAPSHGEYRITSDIIFTPAGQRIEKVTYAPASSLVDFSLSPEDDRDLRDIQPFVLTTEDLPKYDIQYVGREKLDDLNSYVFRVAPKRMEKGQRYFQGTVWVDDQDLAVVKSDGKAVPDLKNNLFPRFITYRENIEGKFWFPTYTHADDVLHFSSGDVHIRMTVRYRNYKRFGSTIRLGESKQLPTPPDSETTPKK